LFSTCTVDACDAEPVELVRRARIQGSIILSVLVSIGKLSNFVIKTILNVADASYSLGPHPRRNEWSIQSQAQSTFGSHIYLNYDGPWFQASFYILYDFVKGEIFKSQVISVVRKYMPTKESIEFSTCVGITKQF
jgi:hypothetical protein